MLAADEIISLNVVARIVQDRHSVLLRNGKDSRKIRDLDEPKVNGYLPKAIVEPFYTDAVF